MKQSQDFEAQQVAELCDTDDWGNSVVINVSFLSEMCYC